MEGNRILPVTQKYHLQSDAHIFQRTKEPMKEAYELQGTVLQKKNEASKNEF